MTRLNFQLFEHQGHDRRSTGGGDGEPVLVKVRRYGLLGHIDGLQRHPGQEQVPGYGGESRRDCIGCDALLVPKLLNHPAGPLRRSIGHVRTPRRSGRSVGARARDTLLTPQAQLGLGP